MGLDFRRIILRELKRRHKSRYWLAEQVADPPSRNAVYQYLRGDGDMMARHVAKMLDALQLRVR